MHALDAWEKRWAPYDEKTYQTVLSYVRSNDVVLDIGAGDLRLSRQVASIARQVYAIEMQAELLQTDQPVPGNLTVIWGDARYVAWPKYISLGILLMRHCTHVGLYVARLRARGCQRLVTNARWGMGVELMDLGPRQAGSTVGIGWYACTCGQTGFIPGPPEQLTEERIDDIAEIESCPACDPRLKFQSIL